MKRISCHIERLGRHAAVELGIGTQQPRCLLGMFLTENGAAELLGVRNEVILILLSRVPSHIAEEGDWVLHWFEVTYVDNPNLVDAVLVAEVHLLPHARYWRDVHPFGVTRTAHIIKVVIHTIFEKYTQLVAFLFIAFGRAFVQR